MNGASAAMTPQLPPPSTPDNVFALVPPVSPTLAPPTLIPSTPSLAPNPTLVGSDRRRLQQARDSLIDCEDALLYVVVHDATLQPLIDQIVSVLMDVSRRADAAISAPTDTLPPAPTQEG